MDPARAELIQKYMTAWFNYYLHYDTDYYYYVLCSHDGAGNEHRLSSEINATTSGEGPPDVTPTPEPTPEPTPKPAPTATPESDDKVYLPCIFKNCP